MGAAVTYYSDGTGEAGHDRLGFAFCLALALHAAFILGVSFNREDRSTAPPKLEITLAQYQSETAPEEADFLAQNDQQGSGTLEDKAMLTTRKPAEFNDNTIREVTPQQQRLASQPRAAADKRVTTTDSRRQTASSDERREQSQETPETEAQRSIRQRSLEIASLEAKLDIQRQAYAKRPRIRRLTSLATKRSADARYLHDWRTKVEAIGNQHYPARARQQELYGDLRMVVSLLPNGDVHSVKILESSGHKILDQAAVRIVHQAAPYEPFPRQMQQEVDVLEIIRTWRFHKDRLTSST